MKLVLTLIAAICVAAKAATRSVVDGTTCSSLNGPFCDGFGSGFALAPLHAKQNLDFSEEVRTTVVTW